MMTRKDYIKIAATIKHTKATSSPLYEAQDAIDQAAKNLADDFIEDNYRFDEYEFLKACGVVT